MDYKAHIATMHNELGIPSDYAKDCGMVLQTECQQLVATELDVFERQPFLAAEAFQAWTKMQAAAATKGVCLQIVSAYRSVDYQKGLLLKKIAQGQDIIQILKVNAAPGYSEHHSGLALDIGCPDFEHLSEDFENSPAFEWLVEHAQDFCFSLSFPKNNCHGILYEPWHWKFSPLSP